MRTTRLRVTLLDVVPQVERLIDVPAAALLPEVHDVLQVALGWTDSHLHQFVAGSQVYGVPHEDDWQEQVDEATTRLAYLPGRWRYLYDFGDGWEHDVEVLGAGDVQPGCVAGSGACPPEDCGGPPGYEHLQDVLADPQHEEHEEMLVWSGGLRQFDLRAADLLVRQTVGEVPGSVRLLLDLLTGGVTLTPGGRLPRSVVRQVHAQRPDWYDLGRPASIEDDLRPLVELHAALRKVGLLRLAGRVLRPTKAAADDLQVVRRLRTLFPANSFEDLLAGCATALLLAHGSESTDELVARLLPLLSGWSADGQPLQVESLRRELYRVGAPLRGLDVISGEQDWRAGPSARTLLPRVTALAALWAPHPSAKVR